MALYIERIFRHPKSKVWYADARREGVRERFSLKTRDPKIAQERRRAYALADASPGRFCTETIAKAIATMIERCTTDAHVGKGKRASATTAAVYEDHARALIRHFGEDATLTVLTPATVAEYVATRSTTPCERNPSKMIHSLTIAKELTVLRLALKSAQQRGVWDGDIARIVPSNKPRYEARETWLTEHEAEIMLAELEDPKRKRWAALATFAGLRKSEVAALTWDRVTLTKEPRGGEFGETYGEIALKGTKRERAKRPIPIVPQLAAILLEVPERERKGLVAGAWRNVIRGCTAALSRACDAEASVRGERRKPNTKRPVPKHVTPNDLRRTFASWLIQAGVSNRLVADLLGHTSTAMVDRVYARTAGSSALHRAVSAIARPLEPAIVPAPVVAAPTPKPSPEVMAKVNAMLTLMGEDADTVRAALLAGCAQSEPPQRRKTSRGGARGTAARALSSGNKQN